MVADGNLPDGWEWKTIGDVVTSMKNGIYKPADFYVDGGIACLRMYNIEDGAIVWKDIKRMKLTEDEIETYRLLPGDILINRVNSRELVGKAAVIPYGIEPTVYESKNIRLKINEELANSKFIGFCFWAFGQQYFNRNAQQVVGMASINQTQIAQMPIPLPPLDEQRRIVSRIEELFSDLDAGVAALERVHAGLRRYKASVLKEACEGRLFGDIELGNEGLPVGWRWATVEDLAADEKYSLAIGPFGSNLKVVDYRDEGVPLVFVRNIRSANFDDTHYVTKEKAEELKAHQIAGGDILITKMGEPPGDACLYPESRPDAVITADCIKWRVSPELVDKRFIVHMINSPVMQKQIQQITRGVAQKKVSLDRFRGLSVPLPPLEEQRRIVEEVERRLSVVGEVESAVEVGLVRAGRLRQSVLRSAFEGRL